MNKLSDNDLLMLWQASQLNVGSKAASIHDKQINLALSELIKLREFVLASGRHNAICYYCQKPCDSMSGNPSEWPIPLCHADEPGVVKWHHIGCVSERLCKCPS